MIVGDREGLAYPVSICISYVTIVMLGYLLHTSVTFGEPRTMSSLLRYAVAMAGSIPATLMLLLLFKTFLRWPMMIASPASSATMLVLNYLTSRWAIRSPSLRSAGQF